MSYHIFRGWEELADRGGSGGECGRGSDLGLCDPQLNAPSESWLHHTVGQPRLHQALSALVHHGVWTDEPDRGLLLFSWWLFRFRPVSPPAHPSPRGQKSHNRRPELPSSHRPPTCPQPARQSSCFPSLSSRPRTILDPEAGPCGQRSQAPEELECHTAALQTVWWNAAIPRTTGSNKSRERGADWRISLRREQLREAAAPSYVMEIVTIPLWHQNEARGNFQE